MHDDDVLNQLTIDRISGRDDAAAVEICALLDSIHDEMAKPEWYRRTKLPLMLDKLEGGFAWRAYDGDELVAYFVFSDDAEARYAARLDGDVIKASTVGVAPKWRGHHLMRRLLEMGEQDAREMGYAWSLATVHPDNAPSRHTFERFGYEMIGRSEFKSEDSLTGVTPRLLLAKRIG